MVRSNISIDIAISTLNDGLYNPIFKSDLNYIIIHQVTNKKDYHQYVLTLPSNVRYIQSDTIGLSKSRNLAIENTNADYLWIMDDDVEIKDGILAYIEELINANKKTAMFVVSHSHEDIEYIGDSLIRPVNRISAMNIFSIDMILNIKLIKNIRFNESFGLGAKYPSGEEYIFAMNLISKKMRILKSKKVCSYHPLDSSGLNFYSSPVKLKAKLEMFKIANGYFFGNILYLLFLIKKSKVIIKNKSFKNVIMSYMK